MPKQYRVVYANTPDELANTVTDEIQNGFRPIGGMAVMAMGNQGYFYQAVVKDA